ncbi:helix-turn-helix domain-containing protein [Vibrio tritonius]|uniref:helix-turn-helix domain-containing protein n=1 Tax=Vibrio tritonius TaxID=1435069 RepID=UPI0018D36D94
MSTTTVHLPITDISHAVGFNEHRRMIAAFRTYCGVTPSEYRKKFMSNQDWRSASSNLGAFPYRPTKLKV